MEKFEEFISQEKKAKPEKGADVKICLKIIRHGERTKEGVLTDYGREVTRKKAKDSKLSGFDAVKAYGSQAGPKNPESMGRSMETAHIYARELDPEGKFKPRPRSVLSYETLALKTPYDHTAVYNANLPPDFEQLPDGEKAEAAKKAQEAVAKHLFSLDTPEARTFKREVAGAFAVLILQKQEMSGRLKSGSDVLMTAGTHSPMPELLLQETLVRKTEAGEEVKGFKDIDEIGGPLNPSESFDVFIERDEEGSAKQIKVGFDNPERPSFPEMYLDGDKLEELAEFYKELHAKDKK